MALILDKDSEQYKRLEKFTEKIFKKKVKEEPKQEIENPEPKETE